MIDNSLNQYMPPCISHKDIANTMTHIPKIEYKLDSEIDRLLALDKLYDFFIPNTTTMEVYQKIYLCIYRSLSKKDKKITIIQRNQNHKRIIQQSFNGGVIGGADSILISGSSGMGKSTSIATAIKYATNSEIIECKDPFQLIIPALVVQTPFDCSVKALLLQILRQVDEILSTNYTPKTIPTTDVLIATTCQVCSNNLACLVLDEVQNVVNHKSGNALVQCITELINSSGISIVMVGTNECRQFFSSTEYLARRATEIRFNPMSYDDDFKLFCKTLWNYQPLLNPSCISEADYEFLYEHSAGIVANIITLIHDAQELAILSGLETINRTILNKVYLDRMGTLHSFINPHISLSAPTSHIRNNKERTKQIHKLSNQTPISNCIAKAKQNNMDCISMLKNIIPITEVSI